MEANGVPDVALQGAMVEMRREEQGPSGKLVRIEQSSSCSTCYALATQI